MNTPQFCLPIQKTKTSEIEEILGAEHMKQEYAYFEIWLDLIEDFNETWLEKIIHTYDKQLLFLFRRPDLAPIHMPIEERKKIIDMISQSNALVDLDISQTEELTYIQEKQMKHLVLSYHNYELTPDEKTLENIVTAMNIYQPAIYKIATMCDTEKDSLLLMHLLEMLKDENKKYIILGMGEQGKIARVYGMLYGNILNFAPRNLDEQSAKGQLTIEDMKKIYTFLNT